MKIAFATSNQFKFDSLQKFLKKVAPEFELKQINTEIPEIQAADNQSVAAFSALWAANQLKQPVIKEDIGFYLEAWNGFPGPLVKDVEQQLGTAGFLQLLSATSNKRAHFKAAIAYAQPGQELAQVATFETKLSGFVTDKTVGLGQGKGGLADQIFIPDGYEITIAQALDEDSFDRPTAHYQQLVNYLKNL